jgi:CPA2 family monovalent cation:H+ antiporter-2
MEKQFLENFQGTAGTFPQEEPETGETSTEKNHELSNK